MNLALRTIHTIWILAALCLAAACSQQPETPTPVYTADSWKTMIDADCRHFFDGCNHCTRAPGSDTAACTRMACEQYQKPHCVEP